MDDDGGPQPMDVEVTQESTEEQRKQQEQERKKQEAKILVRKYYNQLLKGCGREPCYSAICASNPQVNILPKKALGIAIDCVRGNLRLCTVPEKHFSAQEAHEMFSGDIVDRTAITRRLGLVFSDSDILDRSFVSRENGKLKLADAHHDRIDFDELSQAYEILADHEWAVEVTMNAMKRILDQYVSNRKSIGPNSNPVSVRSCLDIFVFRKFILMLANPAFEDPTYSLIYRDLCFAISILPLQNILVQWIEGYPTHLQNLILNTAQQYISINMLSVDPFHVDPSSLRRDIMGSMEVLGIVNRANQKSKRLKRKDFYNEVVNDHLHEKRFIGRDYRNFVEAQTSGVTIFCFCNYPFVMEASSKARVLQEDAGRQMDEEVQGHILSSLFQGQNRINPYLILRVRRAQVVNDTVVQFQAFSEQGSHLKRPLRVIFEGEEGIDQGGVQKEFFQIMFESLLDPQYGMFTFDEDSKLYYFKHGSLSEPQAFETVGALIGLALFNGCILPISLPDFVYKRLCDPTHQPEFSDLQQISPVLADGLQKLLDFDGDVKNTFLRNFTYEYNFFDSKVIKELKEDGANIPLTNENREEYVKLYTNMFLNAGVSAQLEAFERGFLKVCGGNILKWFEWEELELLICGSKELDFEALQSNAEYMDGYTDVSETIQDFWTIVHEMSMDEKKRILAFTTGSDRVPIRGLSDMKFIISRQGPESDRLPSAHTCFNVLLLPDYKDKSKLKERLQTAIQNHQGFGLL